MAKQLGIPQVVTWQTEGGEDIERICQTEKALTKAIQEAVEARRKYRKQPRRNGNGRSVNRGRFTARRRKFPLR